MRKLWLIGILTALMPLACKTGRSGADMTDELARLKKEVLDLETEYDRTAEERQDLEVELERTRTVYEEARLALARRDELRAELEAQGYAPTDAEAYAAVAGVAGGQTRREVAVAASGGESGGGSRPEVESPPRPSGRYTGPHTIHIVKKGECLYKIAGYDQYYGDPGRWPVIYEANAYQIKDPHWIFVGQRLQVPTR